MDKRFQKSLFIFRRDLRLEDNTGLIYALKSSKTVIPCFIFTPEQIDHNPYRSDCCLQFMLESLEELSASLKEQGKKLFFFYDHPEKVVEACIKKLGVDSVVVNRDFTPYSQQRDLKIRHACEKHGAHFQSCDDALLHAPEETLKADGKPYTIFTPYFKNALKLEIPTVQHNSFHNYDTESIVFAEKDDIYDKILPNRSSQIYLKGGRKAGLKILNSITNYAAYDATRDFPSQNATTHLSAYLKFTVISPREVREAIVESLHSQHELIRALHWRDFFSHIAFFFPHVFTGVFNQKYDQLVWHNDEKMFKKWCEGKTGFPIVDAAMRELNQTGFMHNRSRMIVASFLTKDLHINWQWGEKYFAKHLIDYDPAVNNGNWQWAASTGCDAQPYFRIFNPWNQQKKFDAECQYIKQWIPELRQLDAKSIHNWHMQTKGLADYPLPILDHSHEAKIALNLYRCCLL